MITTFVGLGNMGFPMARNLIEGGYDVIGVDLDDQRQAKFQDVGGRVASITDAAEESDVVITMLRTSSQVKRAVDEVLPVLSEGDFFVNMGTTGPDTAHDITESAAEYGVKTLDAPVSGGVGGAKDGTLAIMVGGDSSDFDAMNPQFDIMGENIFHVGDTGTGQTAKLCNQLLVGAEVLSISEAFHLGEAADIDSGQLYDVLTSCIGTSGILEQKGERLINHEFEPGGDVNIQHKDSKLILDFAGETDTPTYLASTIVQVFAHARRAGYGDLDHFAVYKLLEDRQYDR